MTLERVDALATHRSRDGGGPWIETVLLSLAAFALFAATATRDLEAGDAGELLLAARTFGIPHPPGYPLWVWAAGLFSRLPLGPLPFRVALLSAAAAAAGLALVHRLLLRSGAGRLASAAAVTGLALTRSFWSSAGTVEVYPLALLADAGAAWMAVEYAGHGGAQRLFGLGLLTGLALVSHQSAVVFLPVLVLGIWSRLRVEPGFLGHGLAGLGLGLSPFLWLPLRSMQHPMLDWGHNADLSRWWGNLTRACYGPVAQNPLSWTRLVAELRFFAGYQWLEWNGGLLLAAAAGYIAWAMRSWRAALIGAMAVAALPLGLALLLRFDPDPVHGYQISQFLLPMSAALTLPLAHGLDALLRTRLRAVTAGLLAVWLLGSAVLNLPVREGGTPSLARQYAGDLLRGLPHGATLFVDGDNETFTLAYLQKIEGDRTDVRVVQRRGYIFGDLYGLGALPRERWEERRRTVEASMLSSGSGPFYVVGDMALPEGLYAVPQGLAARITRLPEQVPHEHIPALPVTLGEARNSDLVTRKIALAYLECEMRFALERGSLQQALKACQGLAYVGYDVPEAQYNLGRVLWMSGQPEAARAALRNALLLAPQAPWLRRVGREWGVAS